MAQPATGVSLWRFLAWVWVVMRHTKALITAFVGCFLFSLPAWLKPLLRPELQQNLDEWTAFAGEPQTYWYFAIGFFLIGILCASFLAWNEEKDELAEKLHELSDIKRELAEIKRESAYLQASVPKISLSIGKNIEVEVVWENKGAAIAHNTKPMLRLYLRNDRSEDTQREVIRHFQAEFDQYLITHFANTEMAPLLPKSPRPVTYPWSEIYTEALKNQLADGSKSLFVISAVRFNDNVGTHEAHLFQYFTGRFGTVGVNDCIAYNHQINIT